MGAVTVAGDSDGHTPMDGSNAGYIKRVKITMSSSYATGGDTIATTAVGFGQITKCMIGASDGGVGTTGSYLAAPVYDSTGVTLTNIQVFWSGSLSAVFTEVTNGTNLSTVVFDAWLMGT